MVTEFPSEISDVQIDVNSEEQMLYYHQYSCTIREYRTPSS